MFKLSVDKNLLRVLLAVTISLSNTLATKAETSDEINTDLLIGVWSPPGKCNVERSIYRVDGKYFWQKKAGKKWLNKFRGIYIIKNGFVEISEYIGSGSDSFKIRLLTSTTYKGEWTGFEDQFPNDPEKASFTYKRCNSQ